MGEGPKHGVYVGKARDVTCPGDHVTYEFVVYTSHRCSLECIPEKNFFHGGQPPWKCEGNYEVDEDDIVMEVTQQDVTGPRRDSDVHLEISGNDVTFRKTRLAWVGGPPALPSQDPVKLKKAQLQNEEEEAARRKLELETAREEMDKERARQEELARKEKEELEQLREELRRQREAQEAEAAKRRADLEKQKEELRAIEEEKARLARLRQEEFESQEAHEREAKQVQEELNRQREALKALEREREELKEQKEKEARQKQLQREEQKHEAAQMAAEDAKNLIVKVHEYVAKAAENQQAKRVRLDGHALSAFRALGRALETWLGSNRCEEHFQVKLGFYRSDLLRLCNFVRRIVQALSQEEDSERPVRIEELFMAMHALRRQWHLHRGLVRAAASIPGNKAPQDLRSGPCVPLTAEQILCKSILTDCSPDAQFTLSSLRKKFKNRRQQAFRNNLGEKLLS
ncbi:unnamed protein product [Durusdinium trenchii]|uniref:Uncharacterized protein n=1 Tax=Durusdinium trenchii TaxID=1381693 RepID=A0ABP0JRR6_9DINO